MITDTGALSSRSPALNRIETIHYSEVHYWGPLIPVAVVTVRDERLECLFTFFRAPSEGQLAPPQLVESPSVRVVAGGRAGDHVGL